LQTVLVNCLVAESICRDHGKPRLRESRTVFSGPVGGPNTIPWLDRVLPAALTLTVASEATADKSPLCREPTGPKRAIAYRSGLSGYEVELRQIEWCGSEGGLTSLLRGAIDDGTSGMAMGCAEPWLLCMLMIADHAKTPFRAGAFCAALVRRLPIGFATALGRCRPGVLLPTGY
jgi:hypothetical protein